MKEDTEMSNIYNLKFVQACTTPFSSQSQGSLRGIWEIIQHNFLEVVTHENHEYNMQATSTSPLSGNVQIDQKKKPDSIWRPEYFISLTYDASQNICGAN